MNGDWWKRQFGDEDSFALSIALGRDPHPRGAPEIDSGWGGMALWVNGRCLTRNISREAGPCDEIRWNLESILLWLLRVGPRLVNEEPFPFPADACRDACSWIDRTEDAPKPSVAIWNPNGSRNDRSGAAIMRCDARRATSHCPTSLFVVRVVLWKSLGTTRLGARRAPASTSWNGAARSS